jgi:hypothetical protein
MQDTVECQQQWSAAGLCLSIRINTIRYPGFPFQRNGFFELTSTGARVLLSFAAEDNASLPLAGAARSRGTDLSVRHLVLLGNLLFTIAPPTQMPSAGKARVGRSGQFCIGKRFYPPAFRIRTPFRYQCPCQPFYANPTHPNLQSIRSANAVRCAPAVVRSKSIPLNACHARRICPCPTDRGQRGSPEQA